MSRRTSGSDSIAFWIPVRSLGDAASPISRLFISMARTMATMPSSTPIASVPTPSQTASSVTSAVVTAAERDHEADQRAEVLEQHDGQLGRLRPCG